MFIIIIIIVIVINSTNTNTNNKDNTNTNTSNTIKRLARLGTENPPGLEKVGAGGSGEAKPRTAARRGPRER